MRQEGLSPPTRGNRPNEHREIRRIGSIPAHAGEPRQPRTAESRFGVYPRPRGGTHTEDLEWRTIMGLSPPTRGNRRSESAVVARRRSIPAHAGEPPQREQRPTQREVYPRPRGGTGARPRRRVRGAGLSPPTRGNQSTPATKSPCRRSIPAHAGEPQRKRDGVQQRRVYPRPRGGTPNARRRSPPFEGLSPPTRGNRPLTVARPLSSGSIPAHAGEPRRAPF